MDDSPFTDFAAEDLALPPLCESYQCAGNIGADSGWTHLMKLCAAAKYRREAIDIIRGLIADARASDESSAVESPSDESSADESSSDEPSAVESHPPASKLRDMLEANTTTFYHCAVYYAIRDPELLQILLEAGAVVNFVIKVNLGGVAEWVYSADILPYIPIECVKLILAQGLHIANYRTSPVITCVQNEQHEHLVELLRAGFSPNVCAPIDGINYSILFNCVRFGKKKYFHTLISFGADITMDITDLVFFLYSDKRMKKTDAEYYLRLIVDYGGSARVNFKSRCTSAQLKTIYEELEVRAKYKSKHCRNIKVITDYPMGAIQLKLKQE